jgi:hypothetical protein
VNRILFQQDQSAPKVMLDVGGYRSQAREALVKKARDAADKVRRWGDIVELEPMGSFDRRIVHHALRDDPDVETHSVEVDGTDKKALILRRRSTDRVRQQGFARKAIKTFAPKEKARTKPCPRFFVFQNFTGQPL